MKRIHLLAVLALILSLIYEGNVFCKPPQKDKKYYKEWKTIDSLEGLRLPKSAIELVNKIYTESKTENNYPQFVKSVIYKLKFESQMEEGYDVKAIQSVSAEIKNSKFPVKNVLQSMLAELYWSYYKNNRNKLLDRTTTKYFKEDDIATWDIKKIVKECIDNYLLSLDPTPTPPQMGWGKTPPTQPQVGRGETPDSLKNIPINIYDAILTGGNKETSRKLRPTLFDFLAHRAVDFFMNDEAGITVPVYKFEIDNPEYFSSADKFVKLDIKSKDSMSMKLYAMKILQELVAFHMNDKDPQALIDVEIKRYKFLKNNATTDSKDSLYLNGLLKLDMRYENNEFSTDILYAIAEEYSDKGRLYNPNASNEHKWDLKTAMDYCNEAIKRFPDVYGADNCKKLIENLKELSLGIIFDNEILPDKPCLALIQYKNTKTVYLRLVNSDLEKDNNLTETIYGKQLAEKYLTFPAVKEWKQELLDDGDYQEHKTEIKLPDMSKGYYVLLASTSQDFSFDNQIVIIKKFQVTNISYISRNNSNGDIDFYVLNRETGAAIADAEVQTYYREYDNVTKTTNTIKWKLFKTDNEGYFEILSTRDNNFNKPLYAVFSYNGDKYLSENYFYTNGYNAKTKQPFLKTYFFTDREIYRPGQTIYFKGIMTEKDGDKISIKPNTKTTVVLYNVLHREEVSKINLVSNEYGSISGTFTATTGLLDGKMFLTNSGENSIRNQWLGGKQIIVEEYKSPKFEVVFETMKGSYKLGENVSIKGIAKAYSGNSIDNASVKYRVVRKSRFPFIWNFRWDNYFPVTRQEMEIENGVLTTDEKGKFTIEFKAIPDKQLSKHYKPLFDYIVYADVTDVNGETHSAETNVSVSYNALIADVQIGESKAGNNNKSLMFGNNKQEKIDKTKDNIISYKITNLNGAPQKSKGTITIYKLKQPARLMLSRKWDKPDKFVINKDEFYKAFPNETYDDEDNITKWEKEKIIKTFDVETDTSKSLRTLAADLKHEEEGTYMLEIKASDISGEKVEKQIYFSIFSSKDKRMGEYEEDWFTMTKDKGEPGEKAGFIIGSKDKNLNVLYEVEVKDKIISKEWIELSDEKHLIEIPINEDYRGNFAIHLTFVKNNRSYKHDEIITVPYTNKNIDIAFESFRNKLLPGKNEEWKLTLKDKQGDRLTAEMVAGMYDASLDDFVPNLWNFNIYNNNNSNKNWRSDYAFETYDGQTIKDRNNKFNKEIIKEYDKLNWFGVRIYGIYNQIYLMSYVKKVEEETVLVNKVNTDLNGNTGRIRSLYKEETKDSTGQKPEEQPITMRKNFNETAFFYPMLETNDKGEIVIKFTVPESLTRWKLLGLAHTKDLKYGQIEKELITQKELMITTNPPRFFREGDKIYFSAKVSNLTDKALSGQAELLLYDAAAANEIPLKILTGTDAEKTFNVQKGQSAALNWGITIPDGIEAITYKIKAIADNYTDGEENTIPVLTNRMLVTESMPLPIRGKQTKEYTFDKLINSKALVTNERHQSVTNERQPSTMKNFKLTLEFTSNPAWLAIQALPSLMETTYESADRMFERYYANSIASYVVNSNPRIKNVFDTWKNFTPETLLSNLEKNQELKNVILQETPWVMQAKNESERKQRVALLFDLNKMTNETDVSLAKLEQLQKPNGGWCWFEGMPESEYFTKYIITGLGHLKKIENGKLKIENEDFKNMIHKGLFYLDDRIREEYEEMKKRSNYDMDKMHIGSEEIQYLYARSYFDNETELNNNNKEAFEYFKGQAQTYWTSFNIRLQGMIALSLYRYGDEITANAIIKSFKERALHSEEMGMYWKDVTEGYLWYETPVETQALLIETFDEVANDKDAVEEMKVWLLKQKQTQDWKTGSATADACYALLLKGTDILASDKLVDVTIGKEHIDPFKLENTKVEAGTGYFKTSWSGGDIKPEMGNVKVTKTDDGVAWGALYWQYFEQMDKITSSEPHPNPPLKQGREKQGLIIEKKLFIERNSPTGPVIEPVFNFSKGSNFGKDTIKVGDKVKVRIEIRVDRDMDYVHLKDMRAAGFEPENVLSSYKYQGGIGYYESTLDASTNFFIPFLSKGTYVFEYTLIATIQGEFSNGITSIQCLYAPEFGGHSEGERIIIEN